MTNYVKIFNDHFMEFVEDIIQVFPNEVNLIAGKNSLVLIKKSNPRLILKFFQEFIYDKYKIEIINGDIDYFLNKDYMDDFKNCENVDLINKILESINKIKEPIKRMNSEEKEKVVKYMQNLIKIMDLYLTIQNKNN